MSQVVRVKDSKELERCIEIRREVFIREQNVPEEIEIDGNDSKCIHFLAYLAAKDPLNKAVGTARLWIDASGRAKAQRVAVFKEVRGQGIGQDLMVALETQARIDGFETLWLGAQVHALAFYERLGYMAQGDVFLDAGIPHRTMAKSL